jgi:hypothetical protein
MSYRPLTAQQAQEMSAPPLIENGKYQCELMEYSHTDKYNNPLKDSKGEPMTRIRLKIWDKEGRERSLFTNLFWGENNRMSYRTRHFAESFQVLDMYDLGELYEKFNSCLGNLGHCEVYIQQPRAKNDGSGDMWPAKNDIKDFFFEDYSGDKKIDPSMNDDLPF